jgi:vacuolar-type H+-ATPase subunit I/STV1
LQPIQFVLSRGDLSKIDLRIGELFPEGAWLNVLKYEGNLGYLNADLMISDPAFQPPADPSQTLTVELPFNILAVSFLLGALAVSLGIVVEALVVRWSGKK